MNGTSDPVVADIPERYREFIGGHHSSDEIAELLKRLPFDSISLRRTPCYGTCPVYEVVFHRDGRAEYHAQEHLPQLGHFVGKVYPGDYARLCYLIESSGFNTFKSSYRASWTDDTTCIVAVTKGSTSTAVSDYGRVGPIHLWAIQQTLDGIRNRTEWKPAK